MPARSWSISRAEPGAGTASRDEESLGDVSLVVLGGVKPDGIVCATLRKNSSMYCREVGSY